MDPEQIRSLVTTGLAVYGAALSSYSAVMKYREGRPSGVVALALVNEWDDDGELTSQQCRVMFRNWGNRSIFLGLNEIVRFEVLGSSYAAAFDAKTISSNIDLAGPVGVDQSLVLLIDMHRIMSTVERGSAGKPVAKRRIRAVLTDRLERTYVSQWVDIPRFALNTQRNVKGSKLKREVISFVGWRGKRIGTQRTTSR